MNITFVHLGREHLGIEYLSAVLKRAGHRTCLAHDPGLFTLEDNVFYSPFLARAFSRKKEVIAVIESSAPDLVVFSAYTSTYPWVCDIASTVRETMSVRTVMGGVHATLVPDAVIKNEFVDYVVIGEGEYVLLDLVEALSSGGDPGDIAGLWYKKDGRVVRSDIRPPIRDLDSLPMPDKGLFEKEFRFRDDYMTMASRGCPMECSYCCESFFHKVYRDNNFRQRSVGSVMGELKAMAKRYRYKRVMFFDSIFFADKKWISEFLPEYKREIGVPFRCTGHVGFVDETVIRAMKDAGCYCVDFGVQTFNEDTRRELLNRPETNAQVHRAFSICDRERLRYDVDLMLGLPLVTENDYKLPVEFMREHIYFNRLKCYNLVYYPGLELLDRARELGIAGEEDRGRIEKGEIGNWFHVDSIKDYKTKKTKKDFENLYKLLPIIPRGAWESLIKKRLYRFFHYIPGFAVVLGQMVIGLFRKDYRFYIYIMNYFHQFKKRLFRPGKITL